MKHLKKFTAAVLAAAALGALLGAGSASATTLEVGGVKQTGSVSLKASLSAGNSTTLRDTSGFWVNTCTTSSFEGSTASPFTGATVTAPLKTMSFSSCSSEPVVAHKPGTLHVAHITGTTNGTLTSSGAEITTPSPFGTINCKTEAGTHFGTLYGSSGVLGVRVGLSCGGISVQWVGGYVMTVPSASGVVA